MSGPSILVSGASIAGPTLAGWLADAGWDVTVVERAGELRREGQNIDVRGTGRQVLRRMGLEEAVRAARTGETGTDFVDEHGRPFASFAAGTDDTGGATAELEILRGQLSRILYDRAAPQVDYVFGNQIAALADDGTGVDVEFAHGPARRFDLVVIAEGLRSRTRALIMPDARVRELDLIGAYATIPRTAADNDRWRVFSPGGGRSVALRPDNLGNTQVFLAALSNVRGITRIPRSEFVTVLRSTFADVGWEVPRILAELDNDSLYYDELGQMKLPTWSRGRVALLGDAAHAAPVSGMSTTLSITGAYVLAGELTTGGADHRGAFARYEQIMRPLVAGAQKFHPGSVELRLVNPSGRVERAVQRAVLRTVASPAIQKLTTLDGPWSRPAADAITLPGYPMTAVAAVRAREVTTSRRSVNPLFWVLAQVGSRVRVDVSASLDATTATLPEPQTVHVPTRHGAVRALVQRAASADPSSPVVLHMHGGGFVNRYPEQDRYIARFLAAQLNVTVVLPDYATAPKVRYPVAEEQMLDVARWLQCSGPEQRWDGDRLLLSGISAGAKLAVNVCQQLHALDAPQPLAAALIVPVTDVSRTDRTSPTRRPAISPFVQRFVNWAYFPDAARRREPLASPRFDESLPAAMPPTVVLTAEYDTLAAEGAELADHLRAGGVDAVHHRFPGVDHGFIAAKPAATVHTALDEITAFFRTRLARPDSG